MKDISRVLALRCRGAGRYAQIIRHVLGLCGFSVSMDSFEGNTDFVILDRISTDDIPDTAAADMIVYDSGCADSDEISRYGTAVTDYENVHGTNPLPECGRIFTFSQEHYAADLACRNVGVQDGIIVFDIVSEGILSRVRVKKDGVDVRDVLLCASALIAAGVPIASVVGYFAE